MAGEAGGTRRRPPDGEPRRLDGPWGEVAVSFGDPAAADWTVDLGAGRPVAVEVRGRRFVAEGRARPLAGLVARAILAGVVAPRGGVLLHAAAVADDAGDAVLFLGRSGAGKTTVSTRARGCLVGDDTVGVWPEGGALRVLATPFISEGGRPPACASARPVAVCTLGWGAPARARRLGRRDLLRALLGSLYRPPAPVDLEAGLQTVLDLAAAATGYHLTFPRDLEFTPAILEGAG